MFDTKKTLIVVYKDELLMNQLKKMIETADDAAGEIVGTKDHSLNVVAWTEKVWLDNKKPGNIQNKVLLLGKIKGVDHLIPVIDIKFDKFGIKYGWAGNQAVLYAEPDALSDREEYEAFLKKLSELPVPDFLKTMKKEIIEAPQDKAVVEIAEQEKNPPAFVRVAKKVFEKGATTVEGIGKQVAEKAGELHKNKSLRKRQMLFYGAFHLYKEGLEQFMNE